MGKLISAASYLFCAAAIAFLSHLELHSDDTGVEVFFILLTTFLLGCWHPARAWQWALLVGLCVPAAGWIWRTPRPAVDFAVPAFVIAAGLAGSYGGALLRRVISTET
jgi:hypothetical protein